MNVIRSVKPHFRAQIVAAEDPQMVGLMFQLLKLTEGCVKKEVDVWTNSAVSTQKLQHLCRLVVQDRPGSPPVCSVPSP